MKGVSLDRTCRSVYHMSSTTLDNPAMYDVWSLLPEVMDPCCLGFQPCGQSSSSQEKTNNRCSVCVSVWEPGHVEPRWIKHCWASFVNLKCGLTWAGISDFLLCKIISWCICAVYRWTTPVLRLSAGNHLRESLLSAFANCVGFEPLELPFAVWCQGDTSAAWVRHK